MLNVTIEAENSRLKVCYSSEIGEKTLPPSHEQLKDQCLLTPKYFCVVYDCAGKADFSKG